MTWESLVPVWRGLVVVAIAAVAVTATTTTIFAAQLAVTVAVHPLHQIGEPLVALSFGDGAGGVTVETLEHTHGTAVGDFGIDGAELLDREVAIKRDGALIRVRACPQTPIRKRTQDLGGFWGSIQGTLCHLMWGDTLWISRFDGGQAPVTARVGAETTAAYDWPALMSGRPQLDARIAAWAWSTDASDFEGDLSWYSGAMERDMSMPRAICVMQLFNHQPHHRGQVHHMLTQFGVKTEDTDIPFMPDEVPEWE